MNEKVTDKTVQRHNFLSDVTVTIATESGVPLDFPDHDWTATLWTVPNGGAGGRARHEYRAGCVAGRMLNCAERDGKLLILLKNHGLGPGYLWMMTKDLLPDPLYQDGSRAVVNPFFTGIELVEGAGDGAAELSAAAVMPYAVVDAYQMAVASGFAGTREEYFAGLAMLPALSRLTADFAGGKALVAEAVNARGGEADASGTFAELAQAVAAVPQSVNPLEAIGYPDNYPLFTDIVEYGKKIQEYWMTAKDSKPTYAFANDTRLTFMPKIDLADRKTSSCDYFWYNCLNLIDVAAVDFRPVTSLANAFENCTRLLSVDIDISECDSLAKTFYYCGVRSIKLRSPKVTGVWAAFGFATQLEELEMDYGMVGNNASIFINDIKLTRMTLRDFGKAKGLTAFNITAAPWGQGTEAARQTLVDTLLNLSADRVADGNPTCTVTLAAASLAALTDEEIAAITAKGYTLTAYPF